MELISLIENKEDMIAIKKAIKEIKQRLRDDE